mgnify:CR=1 FL=1
MLKPITISELLKMFIKHNFQMDDVVMLASDEEGNGYGHLQPDLFAAEMKDGRHAVILSPYAEGQYEDYFEEEEAFKRVDNMFNNLK